MQSLRKRNQAKSRQAPVQIMVSSSIRVPAFQTAGLCWECQVRQGLVLYSHSDDDSQKFKEAELSDPSCKRQETKASSPDSVERISCFQSSSAAV